MMWLGGLHDPKDLKAIKYKHRKDPHTVIDEFEDYCEQFRINGNEVEEAITVCQEILTDIDASTNEIEPNSDVEKEAAKSPKK